ncbi:GyrI-like domain-containing protein [Enterococcus wangshanyuanii]|uniref:AraC effector-binding domain-containing protein n=1 Tax=Enterococcus wangshanyuanii TaxID=2005703 RepID=A0ABQ1PT15_9ENTE|nr:effector binding domain-containing protein [Enterococcus wangshanyuanii]GGD03034.1 hypothetical protein GCM10011573_35640 [Enterococcus wangshanyuanii]
MEKKMKQMTIHGEKIRTNNQNLEDIAKLWGKVPSLGFEGDIFAVYSNYESDHTGNFDLLVGTVTDGSKESVTVVAGNYIVVNVKERTPEAVGDSWNQIWANEEIQGKRTYITDFEHYKTDGSIQIYLSI